MEQIHPKWVNGYLFLSRISLVCTIVENPIEYHTVYSLFFSQKKVKYALDIHFSFPTLSKSIYVQIDILKLIQIEEKNRHLTFSIRENTIQFTGFAGMFFADRRIVKSECNYFTMESIQFSNYNGALFHQRFAFSVRYKLIEKQILCHAAWIHTVKSS